MCVFVCVRCVVLLPFSFIHDCKYCLCLLITVLPASLLLPPPPSFSSLLPPPPPPPPFTPPPLQTAASLAEKDGEIEAARTALAAGEADLKSSEDALAQSEKRCVAAAMGASSDGTSMTFAEQIKELQSAISTSSTQATQAEMTMSHAAAELKAKKPKAKQSEAEYKRQQRDVARLEGDLAAIGAEIEALEYREGEEKELRARRQQLEKERAVARDRVEALEAKLSAVSFDYKDPEPGFDRSQV